MNKQILEDSHFKFWHILFPRENSFKLPKATNVSNKYRGNINGEDSRKQVFEVVGFNLTGSNEGF